MAEGNGDNANQGRTLRDCYAPSVYVSSIVKPPIDADFFEIKPALISMVMQHSFGGLPTEDPFLHLMIFLEYCDTVKFNGVSDEAIRLRLFYFSVRDKASLWLIYLPPGSITTWSQLSKAFLYEYFPPSKTIQLRNQITNFMQGDNESLYDAWERYKVLLRMCPHHGLKDSLVVETFYNGLLYNTTAQGRMMNKSFKHAIEQLESMAQNNGLWATERSHFNPKSGEINEVINLLCEEMAEGNGGNANQERTLRDFLTPSTYVPSITKPPVDANVFKIKPSLIRMVMQHSFGGLPTEDPNLHLMIFLRCCDIVKFDGVSDDAIRLRLFSFSLRDKARLWLHYLPPGSITTWAQLSKAFLTKYFPPQLRSQITNFKQGDSESLYDAWERYKDLLRMFPDHGLKDWLVVETFYSGLLYSKTAQGGLMNKSFDHSIERIENMDESKGLWANERSRSSPRSADIYEADLIDHIAARIDALSEMVEKMVVNTVVQPFSNQGTCERCGVIGHAAVECQIISPLNAQVQESVNHVNEIGDPFLSTYNSGWSNHPNLSYGSSSFNPNQYFQSRSPEFQNQAQSFPYPRAQKMVVNTVVQPFSNQGTCERCGVIGHAAVECQIISPLNAQVQESVNHVNEIGDPFLSTYNSGWSNHPNLSYGSSSFNPNQYFQSRSHEFQNQAQSFPYPPAQKMVVNTVVQPFSNQGTCERCGVIGHAAFECQIISPLNAQVQESVNHVNEIGDPFLSTYNSGWSNHPNLSYGSSFNPNQYFQSRSPEFQNQAQSFPYPPAQKSNLENLWENFITSQTKQNEDFRQQNW